MVAFLLKTDDGERVRIIIWIYAFVFFAALLYMSPRGLIDLYKIIWPLSLSKRKKAYH